VDPDVEGDVVVEFACFDPPEHPPTTTAHTTTTNVPARLTAVP
jgi:hypothetical protein